jgi:hypothetical protein
LREGRLGGRPSCLGVGCGLWAGLDAVVVGAPAFDGLLDLLFGEVFADGAAGEFGEFGVGGEAEGDVLAGGEGVELGELGWGDDAGDSQALFEANDAVLILSGIHAGLESEQEQNDRDQDGPGAASDVSQVVMAVPDTDGDDVEHKDGKDAEVKEGIDAAVIFVGLGRGHGWFLVQMG